MTDSESTEDTSLKDRIVARIVALKAERDQFVAHANAHVAGYHAAINELEALDVPTSATQGSEMPLPTEEGGS